MFSLPSKNKKMAFSGVLNDAEVKAALDACSGEPHRLY